MHQKGEGDTSKREMIILFSRRQIVKATTGYYECRIIIPMFSIALFARFTFLTLLLFHPLCFLLTPIVFLPLFAGEFHEGR